MQKKFVFVSRDDFHQLSNGIVDFCGPFQCSLKMTDIFDKKFVIPGKEDLLKAERFGGNTVPIVFDSKKMKIKKGGPPPEPLAPKFHPLLRGLQGYVAYACKECRSADDEWKRRLLNIVEIDVVHEEVLVVIVCPACGYELEIDLGDKNKRFIEKLNRVISSSERFVSKSAFLDFLKKHNLED